MKRKKGFTLIELLGVLILLAVISLIAYPIIDKVLTNAKNEAYERQKDNIIEAARMYVTMNGTNNTSTKQLSFQTLIDAGLLKDGEILDPRDSSKNMPGCILYNWSNSKNQYIFEYSEECVLPAYVVGDLLKVQVSDSETQNIYVLEVNGDEIVGILDRNLPGGTVAWISVEDYKTATGSDMQTDYENNPEQLNQNLYTYGAVTANKTLNERTSSWNKVTKKYLPEAEDILKLTEYYKELEASGETSNWESKYSTDFSNFILDNIEINDCIFRKECQEAIIAAGGEKYLFPEWVTINLATNGDNSAGVGYWTNKLVNVNVASNIGNVWNVLNSGIFFVTSLDDDSGLGIRPVIHISQSNVVSKLDSPEYVNPDEIGSIPH